MGSGANKLGVRAISAEIVVCIVLEVLHCDSRIIFLSSLIFDEHVVLCGSYPAYEELCSLSSDSNSIGVKYLLKGKVTL